MPKHWYDHMSAFKLDREIGGDFNQRICAFRKPRFMIYRYPAKMSEYHTYLKKSSSNAMRRFGKSLEEIHSAQELSKDEAEFLMWYYKKMPVGLSECTMNRITNCVEQRLSEFRDAWSKQSSSFDYTIYKCGVEYDNGEYNSICRKLDEYQDNLKCYIVNHRNDDDANAVSDAHDMILNELARDCELICPDERRLCDLLLDATYGRNKYQNVAWELCGDVIVENLLVQNDNKFKFLEKNEYGAIEYQGEYYRMVECDAEEIDIERDTGSEECNSDWESREESNYDD